MKVSQIAGFLGSGKTSALMKIASQLVEQGNRIAIIVNDVGEISIDSRFVEANGLEAKEISGGCICCQIAGSFAETLAKLHDSFDPNIVIVEPSGVAIPWGLKRAAEYSEVKADMIVEHAPVITLVDASRIDMLLKAVRRLVETQIREADICFVNKVDISSPQNIEMTEELIRTINPNAEISYMSTQTGQGIDFACEAIVSRISPRYDDSIEEERLRSQYKGGN